jgi:hypothetical protein
LLYWCGNGRANLAIVVLKGEVPSALYTAMQPWPSHFSGYTVPKLGLLQPFPRRSTQLPAYNEGPPCFPVSALSRSPP